MEHGTTELLLKTRKWAFNSQYRVKAQKVIFSAQQFFQSPDDIQQKAIVLLVDYLLQQKNLAFYNGSLLTRLFEYSPQLKSTVSTIITNEVNEPTFLGIPVVTIDNIPKEITTVFLTDISYFPRMQQRLELSAKLEVIDIDILPELNLDLIPEHAWSSSCEHIYPIKVPKIKFEKNQDLIVIDCPARNLSMMPNGVGYLHNALKKTNIKFQTFDLDVIAYHQFHIQRIFDEGGKVVLPNGKKLPIDPWLAENYDVWEDKDVMTYFQPIINETISEICKAHPKVLGLSIQQCNKKIAQQIVAQVKENCPEIVILVGGFSCYHASIGLRAFPECDYMCIAEADLTVGPLVEALARGERPHNQPGILSRYDTPDYQYIPAPMPHNLDLIEFPKYDWVDSLDIYRNYNGYQLTPIIASRGCMWSRCTFCAERFFWRIRSPENFVDELEWLVEQGCDLFMFNESDLNGRPEILLQICDEIIRRDIKVKLTGQLRINKKSDRAFFNKLSEAGFVALRFGVDAFSKNALKLQKKGYTVETISQNLKDCVEAGIYTEVNWVIGVPGETWDDINEGVELILANRAYIGRLSNINPLILVNGGVYWLEPEKHNIVLHIDKEEINKKHPSYLPADKWHSENPYIDGQVRRKYFEHIVVSLHKANFPLGEWAQRVVDDCVTGRDKARRLVDSDHSKDTEATKDTESVDKQIPQLKRVLNTHHIFTFKGNYYAVPSALGNIDFFDAKQLSQPGILIDKSEATLVEKVENTSGWANARGLYDSQENQKKTKPIIKAGSSLIGEEQITEQVYKSKIVTCNGEYFSITPKNLQKVSLAIDTKLNEKFTVKIVNFQYNNLWHRHLRPLITRKLSAQAKTRIKMYLTKIEMRFGSFQLLNRLIKSPHHDTFSEPKLIKSVSNYNIVEYKEIIYAIPQNLGEVKLDKVNVTKLPGVLWRLTITDAEVAIQKRLNNPWRTYLPPSAWPQLLRQLIRHFNNKTQTAHAKAADTTSPTTLTPKTSEPILIKTIGGYKIVSYEGIVYGIPQALEPVDLQRDDVIGMPGVIHDASPVTVENEILELTT